MAIVTIQAPILSDTQKKRIGERVLDSLHSEGIPASSIVVLFRPEDTDIFLDGGLLFSVKPQQQTPPSAPSATITTVAKQTPVAPKAPAPPAPKPPAPQPSQAQTLPKTRKAIPEFTVVKEKVRSMVLNRGGLSSFEAQSGLNLKGYDGASAILRKVFAELEDEGMVERIGQKRGTRYVLKGMASLPPHQAAPVILVKQGKAESEGGVGAPDERKEIEAEAAAGDDAVVVKEAPDTATNGRPDIAAEREEPETEHEKSAGMLPGQSDKEAEPAPIHDLPADHGKPGTEPEGSKADIGI